MIQIPPDKGHFEFKQIIWRIGVPCEVVPMAVMPYGDACFQGNGPDGPISVGIERKKIHDLLQCIDDHRLSARQMVGMRETYHKCYLYVEGLFKPHEDGTLMEGFLGKDGKLSWGPLRYRSQTVKYSKLRRYLFSIAHGGFDVVYTRDIFQTAYDVTEAYHYWNKKWKDHTSLLELQKFALPCLTGEPSLTRKWAHDIRGIGIKHSEQAEKVFKSPIKLATASEMEWLRIEGIGVDTAQRIVREINGISA